MTHWSRRPRITHHQDLIICTQFFHNSFWVILRQTDKQTKAKSSNLLGGAVSLQWFDTVVRLVGRQGGHLARKKSGVGWLVCWWWRSDWNFARSSSSHSPPPPSSLAPMKSRTEVILVPAYPSCPGKCPLNECRVSFLVALITDRFNFVFIVTLHACSAAFAHLVTRWRHPQALTTACIIIKLKVCVKYL